MPSSIPASTVEKFTTFGDLLRFLRRRTGLTQLELSIAVGYSDTQISRLEQNLRLPDIATIEARFVPALGLEDEPKAVARLLELAAQVRREDAPALGLCPYKGLNYFDEADADLFVGREDLTTKLVERVLALTPIGLPLPAGRFLAIVGASGSGKSSLVRAGVVSALRWNKISADWQIHILTPTAHPLDSLAASLTQGNAPASATSMLIDDFARSPRGLHLLAKRKLPSDTDTRLLLVIDQFEELFALCRSEEERAAFIDNLLTAAYEPDGPIILVITLRADFYAHCANYLQLREALAQQQEYIGAMSHAELRRAIEEPARRGRWELDQGLVDLLLRDAGAGSEPGALPLLSHALLETWQRRRGRMMTMGGYASSGGVRGAIAETAETVFVDQFTREQQAIARRIFLRLTELGDEVTAADTRRRARFNELILRPEETATTRAVLKALADARLITTSEDSAEVAHEALIREWPTLRGWLEENREGLRLHRQLTEAAQEWASLDRAPDVLYRGVRLAQAQDWAKGHEDEMNPLEREFITTCIEQNDREMRERDAQRQRELDSARRIAEAAQKLAETERRSAQQLRRRAVFLSGALLLVFVLTGIAFFFGGQANWNAAVAQQNALEANQNAHAAAVAQATSVANAAIAQQAKVEADTQRDAARKAEAKALTQQRIATARELAAGADNNLSVDPERSILLALQGMEVTAPDGFILPEVENALHRAIAASRIMKTLDAHDGSAWALAYSPDGAHLATGGQDKRVRVWDTTTYENVLSINAHDADVDSLAFSPDGKRLATSSDDGTAKIWDAATGQLLLTLQGHDDWVTTVAFHPDGTQLATISQDNSFKIWDAATGNELASWQIENPGVSLSYSPDGARILFWADNQLHIRDARSGEGISSIPAGDYVFALSPAGTRLAMISEDAQWISVLDTTTNQPIYNIKRPANRLERMAFSPDGSQLAAAGRDRKVHVWDAGTGVEQLTLGGHTEFLFNLAFSPDGQHLASAGFDGVVKIWSLEPSYEVLTIPSVGFNRMALSPDGTRIAANGVVNPETGQPNLFRVWDAENGKLIFEQQAHENRGMAVVFSPDGKEIATGGDDQLLKVTDAVSGETVLAQPVEDGVLLGIAYRPDGKVLAAVGTSGIIRLVDRATGKVLQTWDAGLGEISSAAFSPDGVQLAVVSSDVNDAKIFDASTGKELVTLTGHTNSNWGVDFNADGSRLVTAGRDGTARLWDAATGQLLHTFTGHASAIGAVRFSPDDSRLATAGTDGTVRVWDVSTGAQLLEVEGFTAGVDFTPDGKHLVLPALTNAGIKIMALTVDELTQIAKHRLTRTWTLEECQKFLHVEQCPTR
jgi:WD40 repeat protein